MLDFQTEFFKRIRSMIVWASEYPFIHELNLSPSITINANILIRTTVIE